MSKSALIRLCLARELSREPDDNVLLALLELSKEAADVEPVDDIDAFLYGPLEAES
jgi:hypothetical protein